MLSVFAAEAPNGVHLAGDIREVYWGSLAFFVVLGLMLRYGWPAMRRAFAARTERIEAELADARRQRDEAEAFLNTSSADLPDVSSEEERIRSEAVEQAARLKADLIAQAEADAEEIRTRGTVEVENFRRQAITDLSNEMSRLTRESTEAVVVEQLDDAAQSDLIENYINQVQQL